MFILPPSQWQMPVHLRDHLRRHGPTFLFADHSLQELLTKNRHLPRYSRRRTMISSAKSWFLVPLLELFNRLPWRRSPFYRVFEGHPKSITRAVAYNIVGPALQQALYPYRNYEPGDDPSAMATVCPEDSINPVIAPKERARLEENARVVWKLEDIYSLTVKDRMSQTSALSFDESWRFRRAMYRIMLYCKMFPFAPSYNESDEEFETLRAQRTAILTQYAADVGELQQLSSVVKYLTNIFYKLNGTLDISTDALLTASPSGALRAWEARSYDVLQDVVELDSESITELEEGYFDIPLQRIWTAREITPSPECGRPSQGILNSINGAEDRSRNALLLGGSHFILKQVGSSILPHDIQECQHVSITAWCLFNLDYDLLKHNLDKNYIISDPFDDAVEPFLESPAALERLIASLFAFRRGKYAGWDPENSYCARCFTHFVQDHIWMWFLQQRLSQGWIPPANCRYGCKCDKQDDDRHGKKKNHLCDPVEDLITWDPPEDKCHCRVCRMG
ncbi:F-box domain-containing protein [Mycena sanguinolenta]|uniref:F-box domain-containing protein n=1 Tax=Mycena sanguinolenta TaxID=230812 RepID=A0A8H6U1F8_9AGAR|nr:F-box domain-containing protein [Mycena sanguinolenta]